MSPERLLLALGWTLAHSLWQLTLVGFAAAALMAAAGAGRPRLQHGLAWGALVLCALWPALTFVNQCMEPTLLASMGPAPVPPVPAKALLGPVSAPLPWSLRIQAPLLRALPWLARAWALGAALMALRMAGGCLSLRRWRDTSMPAPAPWEARLQALSRRMGLRAQVVLRTGGRLASPVALGLWRPMVLVPATLFTQLPEGYVEALLAHELAHVHRHDYLFNLVQNVLEVLLFHHPAVWWISGRIRILREHLADDCAARTLGEPRRLALALDALDSLRALPSPPPHLALAARGGTLFERIHRLVIPAPAKPRPLWVPAALLALALPCAALTLKAAPDAPIPADPAVLAELDALAAKEHLDPQLLRAMAWTESDLEHRARSPLGASGLLQVMPATARKYGADPADPRQVMAAGAHHLRVLLDRYPGDLAKALSAYNGGEAAVDAGQLTEETLRYTPMVLGVYRAKAVQPAAPLPHQAVDGVIRRLGNGSLRISSRISAQGPFTLEVFEDGPGSALLARVEVGGGPAAPSGTWPLSQPVVRTAPTQAKALRIRCEDKRSRTCGEARFPLEGDWKTFAFTLTGAR